MKLCPRCSSRFADTEVFCTNCGVRLIEDNVTGSPQDGVSFFVPGPNSAQSTVSAGSPSQGGAQGDFAGARSYYGTQTGGSYTVAAQDAAGSRDESKQQRKKIWIAFGIFTASVIFAAVIMIIILTGSSKKNNSYSRRSEDSKESVEVTDTTGDDSGSKVADNQDDNSGTEGEQSGKDKDSSGTGSDTGKSSGSDEDAQSGTAEVSGGDSGDSQTGSAVAPENPALAPITEGTVEMGMEYAGDILPGSSSRLLTESDISGMSARELMFARNEIFARHGYIFNDEELLGYFYNCPWYDPTYTSDEFKTGCLSKIEEDNIAFLKTRQRALENNPSAESGSAGTLTLDFLSFTTPASWDGKYSCEYGWTGDVYAAVFTQKSSGIKFMRIALYPCNSYSLSDTPCKAYSDSYYGIRRAPIGGKCIGYYTDENGSQYYLCAEFPTGYSFSVISQRCEWGDMMDSLDSMLSSVKALKGSVKANLLVTDGFELTVPTSWNGKYVCSIVSSESEMRISFYELHAHATMNNGHVFSFRAYGSKSEYEYLPSYEKVGTAHAYGKQWTIVAVFPTDVQSLQDYAKAYSALYNDYDKILSTFLPYGQED